MNAVNLSYFYALGFALNSMTHLRDDVPSDLRQGITYGASQAVDTLVADDTARGFLPRSYTKATPLASELRLWAMGIYEGRTYANYEQLRRAVESLSTTLVDELDSTFSYTLTGKGNLSLARLVKGASQGYSAEIISTVDESITDEIDQAGRCLAFTMYTASGFHILRSVEIAIKGYVHAATGSLPAVTQRNWGEYIKLLQTSGAATDLVDILRILKTKRNPLMHPQDSLGEDEAIDILCLCQSVTGEVIKDIKARSLEAKFKASLALLPTI